MKDIRIISGKGILPSLQTVCGLLKSGGNAFAEEKIQKSYEALLAQVKMRMQAKAALIVTEEADQPEKSEESDKSNKSDKTGKSRRLYVILTIGDGVSRLAEKYTADQNAFDGMVLDAMADSCLFQFEEQVLSFVRGICKEEQFGIAARLEIPGDLPVETVKNACDLLEAERTLGISVTSGYMLHPVKSMCMVFALAEDGSMCALEHDCSRCGNAQCELRQPKQIHLTVEITHWDGKEYRTCIGFLGENILEILRREQIAIPASCGGAGSCGKCRIQVLQGELPETEADRRCLRVQERAQGVRLACQAVPTADLRIAVPSFQEEGFSALGMPKDGEICMPEDAAAASEPKERYPNPLQTEPVYGIAIDIGTTTLAFALADLTRHQVLDSYTAVNRQRSYGADVISRIRSFNAGNGAQMKRLILEDLQQGIEMLLNRNRVKKENLQKIVIAGNTTMLHILQGYSCKGLGSYPFLPISLAQEQVFLPGIAQEAVLLPGISAFVGADITAGLFALEFYREEKQTLLIDLGTNGEMALKTDRGIFVTSAAAGPAFEGGNISCGMGSVPGAISRVKIHQGKAEINTIGDAAPRGICGTGVVDAVAELWTAGLVDENGKLAEPYFKTGYPLAVTAQGEEICICQQDIREVQMAKAAIRAGIELLLQEAGTDYAAISQVCLAGGFGYFLDGEQAVRLGLLPRALKDRTKAVGNTSLKGAVRFLFAGKEAQEAEKLARQAQEISLAQLPQFPELYLQYMRFGEQ